MAGPSCLIEDITDIEETVASDPIAYADAAPRRRGPGAAGSSGAPHAAAAAAAASGAPPPHFQEDDAAASAGGTSGTVSEDEEPPVSREEQDGAGAGAHATASGGEEQQEPQEGSSRPQPQEQEQEQPQEQEQEQEEVQSQEQEQQQEQGQEQEQEQEQGPEQEQQQEQGQGQEQEQEQPQEPWAPTDAAESAALAAAEAIKAAGNELYGREVYEEAVAKYQEALDTAPEAAPQRAVYFANLAAACLKLDQPQLAAEHCSCALRIDAGYVKALMRRCTAFEAMDDPEHAMADAKRVLELDPSSSWAAAAALRLEPAVKERQEKMKEEMLGKLKDLGNTLLGKFGLSLDNFKAEKDPGSGGYSIRFQQ
ncbi:hypothetical protein Rsub_06535 [Raphidocelis subcapitata]|uniref:Uncharacterized protein n=1 Tax=Raphidocelis subcapitata TaxID=307507 RepID=A0A2V0PAZ0_9CHLO|nr:hypothetical protein Rsub_06535 [Raphidocelis subcapitata]|eukprot:GBF94265.1 hypothetical protein Rsub_06535 [Raphidocelis subcapitata]